MNVKYTIVSKLMLIILKKQLIYFLRKKTQKSQRKCYVFLFIVIFHIELSHLMIEIIRGLIKIF